MVFSLTRYGSYPERAAAHSCSEGVLPLGSVYVRPSLYRTFTSLRSYFDPGASGQGVLGQIFCLSGCAGTEFRTAVGVIDLRQYAAQPVSPCRFVLSERSPTYLFFLVSKLLAARSTRIDFFNPPFSMPSISRRNSRDRRFKPNHLRYRPRITAVLSVGIHVPIAGCRIDSPLDRW